MTKLHSVFLAAIKMQNNGRHLRFIAVFEELVDDELPNEEHECYCVHVVDARIKSVSSADLSLLQLATAAARKE